MPVHSRIGKASTRPATRSHLGLPTVLRVGGSRVARPGVIAAGDSALIEKPASEAATPRKAG
jgi:hypothetical protein